MISITNNTNGIIWILHGNVNIIRNVVNENWTQKMSNALLYKYVQFQN